MNNAAKWMGILIVCGMLVPCHADSQIIRSSVRQAGLMGYVTDSVTQNAIAGAMVSVEDYPAVFTDSTGFYSMAVTTGIYNVTCAAFGYHKKIEEGFTVTGVMQLDFALTDDPCGPPLDARGALVNFNYAFISWNPTSNATSPDDWIAFDNGINATSIGLVGGGSFTVAIRFSSEQLQPYAGCYLTMIKIFPTGMNTQYILKVWTGVNAGFLACEIPLTDPVLNTWNETLIDVPVYIDPSQELWFGYDCLNHPAGVYPAGCDNGPAVTGFGDLFSLDGTTWETLTSYGFDNNWNIEGFVLNPNAMPAGPVKMNQNRSLLGFNIYRNNQLMPQSPLQHNLFLDGPLPLSSVFIYYITALYSDCESVPSHQVVVWTPVGIDDKNSENPVTLYPNPASDILTVKSDTPVKYLYIYNDLGVLVKSVTANAREVRVDISVCYRGMYVVSVMTEKGIYSKGFVVE